MRWKYPFVVAVLLVWPAHAHAQAPAEPEIRQFDIATTEALAGQMYIHDQAAWRATDALMEKYSPDKLGKEGVRGWIVLDRPDGPFVRFIRLGDTGPEAAYDISNALQTPVISIPGDRQLSETEKALYAARSLALDNIATRCSQTYNTIVLKDPQGDGWLAWAMASTMVDGEIAMGIHYRFTVSADGKTIQRRDALTRSCFMMKPEKDHEGKVEAVMTTQLVSNLPVETILFLSLQHRLPIYVSTPDRTLWVAAGNKLHQVDTKTGAVKP